MESAEASGSPGPGDPPPELTRGSALLEDAYAFAYRAHEDPDQDGSGIGHPLDVATLLAGHGLGERAVAAALLHDVVEDTTHPAEEIDDRFPAEVSELVRVLTEDPGIDSYTDRKAEHRDRVLAAGRVPAAIYLADKLARVRRYADAGGEVDPSRLRHYRQTLEQFTAADPELPFLAELREELARLRPGTE